MSFQNLNQRATAACLTPPGRGGVATVRVCGAPSLFQEVVASFFVAGNKKQVDEQKRNRIVYGRWRNEEVVICRREEGVLEIHCHGGEIAVRRILKDLSEMGVSTLSWQEQNRSVGTLLQAEYVEALSQCTTFRTAEIVLQQQAGVFQTALDSIARFIKQGESQAVKESVEKILAWSCFGHHLTVPWKVVLAGRLMLGSRV